MNKSNVGLNNMCNKTIQICLVILFLAILSMAFLRLSKTQNDKIREEIEEFTNKLKREDMEDVRYTKFAETFMEADEENKWENLTLFQAIDKCNNMSDCIGFNRENIGDREDGVCYPVMSKGKCHTARKGDFDQRHKAMNFNFYLKPDSELDKMNTTTADIFNKCVGDIELTMNREIMLKSYAHPDKHIGFYRNNIKLIGDELTHFHKLTAIKFKVVPGLEQSGTVSFKHMHTNKYLYRDENDRIICQKINSRSTDDRLRASFYLHDGLDDQIILVPAKLAGEKEESKVVTLNKNSLTLGVERLKDLQDKESATFDIVDVVKNISIITKRENLEQQNPSRTDGNSENNGKTEEGFSNNVDRMELYQYIESGLNENDFNTELKENTNNSQINIGKFKSLSSIDTAFDKILDTDTRNDNGENLFMKAVKFNRHLYDSNNGLNDQIRSNKDRIKKCVNNINNMMIQDMAKDHYYLKK